MALASGTSIARFSGCQLLSLAPPFCVLPSHTDVARAKSRGWGQRSAPPSPHLGSPPALALSQSAHLSPPPPLRPRGKSSPTGVVPRAKTALGQVLCIHLNGHRRTKHDKVRVRRGERILER
ncbi:hypothetical protein B0I35DRAFT_220743 [Stachybotrys elegans]|uniref:Uncharacterized protein n=1 Tax=Stachybotrys elegans TaxID=80388 RepID=A0A8K0SWE6_9HYPO|nr:hypothetical protein B0I35DRAFT_220743 [Stachybotrys elegans]